MGSGQWAVGSVELVKLRTKVDTIGKAIDEIYEYSYKFNVKVVGLPEVDTRESAQQTSSLCISLLRALGADITIRDIDTAHHVPMRQASVCNINPASLDEKADLAWNLCPSNAENPGNFL